MAKYDITYSCGHEGTVELLGKEKDRQRKIEWYESTGLCPECYKKEMREKEAIDVENAYGNKFNYHLVQIFMDTEIKNNFFRRYENYTQQQRFDEYAKIHHKVFGKQWKLTEENPELIGYSIETESNSFADDLFNTYSYDDALRYISEHNLLESESSVVIAQVVYDKDGRILECIDTISEDEFAEDSKSVMLSLRQARFKVGLSQSKVSQMIGIPLKTLQNWEAYQSGSESSEIREPSKWILNLVIKEILAYKKPEFRFTNQSVENYAKLCKLFARDSRGWEKIDGYKFYTTAGKDDWEETSDNANNGVDVSWAFALTPEEIDLRSGQELYERLMEELYLANTDGWREEDYEKIYHKYSFD